MSARIISTVGRAIDVIVARSLVRICASLRVFACSQRPC